MTTEEKDFLEGLAISAACAALPVRKVYPAVGDLLDNEWPIEWKMSETKGNQVYVSSTMAFRRISDAYAYDYENAACAVTAITADGTTAFTTRNIGVTEQEVGRMIVIKCTVGSSTFYTALLVVDEPGTQGTVEFTERGTYYAFLDANMASTSFSDADLQFTLTAPQLVGYMYNDVGPLSALPEWDEEAHPHAVIVRSNETDTNYRLYLDTTFEATSEGKVSRLFPKDQDFSYKNGVWDEGASGGLSHYVLWTNKDLYYTADAGGGLFMAGSEPVPVYE